MSDENLGCLTKPFLSQNLYWKMSDLSKTLILHPVCKFSSISLINLSSIAFPNEGVGVRKIWVFREKGSKMRVGKY